MLRILRKPCCAELTAYILDGICPEGSILDGLDDLLRTATCKEWFANTRRIIQDTIAEMNLDLMLKQK